MQKHSAKLSFLFHGMKIGGQEIGSSKHPKRQGLGEAVKLRSTKVPALFEMLRERELLCLIIAKVET